MNVIDKSIHADQQKAISNQLAVFALELTFDAIPEKIRERSKYLMLDAIGIAYASQGFHFAGATMAAMTSLGAGASPVIGYGRKLSPRDAALVNGVLAHGLDYDDTHSPGIIHATVSSLPLVLALGDELQDFRPRFSHCLCRCNGDFDAARIGRQRRLPSGRLSSDRPHRHFRLHARRFAAP